jgi:hypothetical protein
MSDIDIDLDLRLSFANNDALMIVGHFAQLTTQEFIWPAAQDCFSTILISSRMNAGRGGSIAIEVWRG